MEQFEARGEEIPVADIAAAFQEAVVDVISAKAVLACREHGIRDVLLGGGVAAKSRLRELTGATEKRFETTRERQLPGEM